MKAIDLVRFSLELTDGLFRRLITGLRDKPLLQPTSGGGNHGLWTLGHLCLIEASLPSILFGEPHPLPDWEKKFGIGSEPSLSQADYPSFDELLKTYETHRQRNLKLLDEVGDAGLDRVPKQIPPGFEKEMATFGQTFLLIALHQMMHSGQTAVTRKAAGLPRFI